MTRSTRALAAPTDVHRATTVESPVGRLTLVATPAGLRAVLWPGDEGRVPLPAVVVAEPDDPVLDRAAAELGEYFAGARRRFDLPLDLRGTEFQQRVWRSLLDIPFGTTSTYGALAARLGRPTAVRAVGAAVGRNPLSVVVPCHRVLASDGSLHGFAGGLAAKRSLLDHERARGAHPGGASA